MSTDNRQIFELAKGGLSAPEIAEALGYDTEAVEFVLKADREIARAVENASKNKLDAEFASMENLVLATMKDIISDPDVKATTRADLCKYVTDQRLGLKTPKLGGNVTINVFDFNERLKEMRRRRAEIEAIDVGESTQRLVAA